MSLRQNLKSSSGALVSEKTMSTSMGGFAPIRNQSFLILVFVTKPPLAKICTILPPNPVGLPGGRRGNWRGKTIHKLTTGSNHAVHIARVVIKNCRARGALNALNALRARRANPTNNGKRHFFSIGEGSKN